MRILKRILKIYVIVMVSYFTVFKIVNMVLNKEKTNTQISQHITKNPIINNKMKTEYSDTSNQNEPPKLRSEIKGVVAQKTVKKSPPSVKPFVKEKFSNSDKKTWKKKIAFRRKNFGALEEWDSDPEMKKILLWTGYGPQQEGMLLWKRVFNSIVSGQCPESRCTFTTDKSVENQAAADAVIFHMPNFHWDKYLKPEIRKPEQNWIFMTYETATNVRMRSRRSSKQVGNKFQLGAKYPPINWKNLDGIFNRTFSFRHDADAVVRHGYFEKVLDDKTTLLPSNPAWTTKFDNYTKDNFNSKENKDKAPIIWFVSHCKSESGRDRFVRKLSQHIGVHIYGKCGKMSCGQDRRLRNPYEVDHDPCFDLVNKEYKFYLSLENDICKDYITEKAFNALKLDTIPIILSGADLATTLPPNSVIDALSRSPEDLADHLYHLLQHKEEYLAHFKWRESYQVVSHESVPSPCNLCAALHSAEWSINKTYQEMATWFNQQSKCHSWDGVNPRVLNKGKKRRKQKRKDTI